MPAGILCNVWCRRRVRVRVGAHLLQGVVGLLSSRAMVTRWVGVMGYPYQYGFCSLEPSMFLASSSHMAAMYIGADHLRGP